MKEITLEKIRQFIDKEPLESRIYIGVDSTVRKKHGKWFADFYTVVVIHKNGCNGCKIFGEIETEQDFSPNKKKPTYRLMQEVYKCSAAYLELADAIGDRAVELHLDLNPDKKYASNLIIEQAIGYIRGTTNIIPMIKPDAFAASYAADRLGRSSDMVRAVGA
jgi:hypothetical protein